MTVRVHLLPLYDAPIDPIDVIPAVDFTTNATNGAGLVADLFDDNNCLIATFANVRYIEKGLHRF